MKQFSNSRGVALLTVLLLILIMSLLATQLTQVLFKDIRNSKNVEFNSLSNLYIDFLQSHFQDVFGESITQNKSNLNKSTVLAINNYGIEFQGLQANFEVKDLSNCFNINALFLERDGAILINQKTLMFFKELLEAIEFDKAQVDTITDSIIDWVDEDNLPRAYGSENYYYTGPTQASPRFTSKRLFYNTSELRQLPALRNLYDSMQESVCIIPYSNNFSLNLNTLNANNAELFSIFLKTPDVETAESIISRIPLEGYENLQDFFNLESDLANTEFINYLTTKSHTLSLEIILDSGFTSATYVSLMSLNASRLSILDTFKK
jgi:general secretion pathway protein K